MPWVWVEDANWTSLVATVSRIDRNVLTLAKHMTLMEKDMSAIDDALTELGTQVQANTDAEAAAAKTLTDLATLIQQNAGDPARVTELAAKLKTSADALAASIVANTQAAPTA